jgi:undecaprenyl-diphosphatase
VATLGGIDWTLFHAVNAGVAQRDWLEDPVTTFAVLAVPLYAAATFALWFLARPYGDKTWKLAAVSALTASATALVANQMIAHVWDRPRPFAAHGHLTQLLAAPSPDPSFPSDHAAAAFAIAFAVLAFSRWAGVGFLVAATLIGMSRIALGLHYPSDVLAGLLVGWAAAWVVVRLGRPWLGRLVELLSRLSDPLLAPVWERLERVGLGERRT